LISPHVVSISHQPAVPRGTRAQSEAAIQLWINIVAKPPQRPVDNDRLVGCPMIVAVTRIASGKRTRCRIAIPEVGQSRRSRRAGWR